MPVIATYAAYLAISIAMTIWVAHTLSTNGQVFLVESFSGNETLADSVNYLLVVGFYLINVGYVALALRYGQKPVNLQEAIEFLSTKVGLVIVILGIMHFFNMFIIAKLHFVTRKKKLAQNPAKSGAVNPRGQAPAAR